MWSMYKLRHHRLITKSLPYHRVLALFGPQGCGTGQVAVMCGAQAFGAVRLPAIQRGTVAVGTTRLVVAGITVGVTGAKSFSRVFSC